MKAVLHFAAVVIAIATASVLGGCASPAGVPDMAAPGAASTASTDSPAEITGSRIPARRTEKMVSQIGGKDYKNNQQGLAAPLQSN